MKAFACNGYVAVEPYRKDLEVRENKEARMASMTQRTELTPARVVYGTDRFPTGSLVYLRGEAHVDRDALVTLQVEEGKPFILILDRHVALCVPPETA